MPNFYEIWKYAELTHHGTMKAALGSITKLEVEMSSQRPPF